MERSAVRRRRPALSCVRCRRRKIKCDRNDPCGPCVLARQQCAYKIYDERPSVESGDQMRQNAPDSTANVVGNRLPVGAGTPRRSAIETGNEAARVVDAARVPTSSVGQGVIAALATEDADSPATRTPAADVRLEKLLQRVRKLGEPERDNPADSSEGESAELNVSRSGIRSGQVNTNNDKKRTIRWVNKTEFSSEVR